MKKSRSTKLISLLSLFIFMLIAGSAIYAQDNDDCMACHEDHELVAEIKSGGELSLYVDEEKFGTSVHADLSCIDCHADLDGIDDYPHEEKLAQVDCSSCHDDVAAELAESAHAHEDVINGPTCKSCHGTHEILPADDPKSMTSHQNLANTCSSCHSESKISKDPDVHVSPAFSRYMKGIHAEGIERGIGSAATCSDCHGTHDLRKPSDPKSLVNKYQIPKTCAKCHNDIYIQYNRGIHGKALNAGITDAPTCVDCHGEHKILAPSSEDSPVHSANISDFVCARCHNDPRLVEKYGLAKGKFTSYQDSYHGLAVNDGSVKAADCTSCHRAHDILPSSNPASSIHIDNLTKTCQKCHPQATKTFALSYTHNMVFEETNEADTMVRNLYIGLIIVVIGGMVLHNLLILFRYIVEKYRRQKSLKMIERFSTGMIFQHIVVALSFIGLVITGFALRYPDQFWVKMLSYIGLNEALRSTFHRIFAVIMMYISIHHLFFLIFSKRGHLEVREMMPKLQDLRDVIQNLKYYLGMSKEKPNFGKYDYTEKAEYWALAWGTIVMAVTGLILWFPTLFTLYLPAWTIKIAETIHLYEAWLATLAIALFHFFFVIFHPDQYPMSLTWLTGKVTEETAEHHHPAWHKDLQEKEESEASNRTDASTITKDKIIK